MAEEEEEQASVSVLSVQERIDALPRDCLSCDACGQANPRSRCSQCHSVYYCHRECQQKHWKEHKTDCSGMRTIKERHGLSQDTIVVDKDTAAAKNDECPICLTTDIDRPVLLQACQHQFCFPCIRYWQQQPRTSESSPSASLCPLCRSPSDNVDATALERARLLASRAHQLESNKTSDTNMKLVKELRVQAVDQLDQVLEEDNTQLQALITKAEIFLHMDHPQIALTVLDHVIELDNQRHEQASRVAQLLQRFDAAMASGITDDEAQAQLDEMEEQLGNAGGGNLLVRLTGEGPVRHAFLQLYRAEAFELLEEWKQARDVYLDLLKLDDFFAAATPAQQRAVFMGISKCAYHLGVYDKAIGAAQAALEMNRHFPDVHKYMALAYKAQGDLDKAVETMNRAALLETPWDDDHRYDVLELYETLKAELESSTTA